ncbi:zinc ribbon domain-containing protein [Salinibacter ruber]|uniref:zinc ribbon domain-containing protein n=1 Tax=Salinibacter ruber TaxID=146919 RepID=UPI0013C32E1B
MQQNGKLARHITQAGWSRIVRRLRDKCKWYGRTLVIADRWFPSSQRCSECGHVDGKKSLDVRDWTCDECGTCQRSEEPEWGPSRPEFKHLET